MFASEYCKSKHQTLYMGFKEKINESACCHVFMLLSAREGSPYRAVAAGPVSPVSTGPLFLLLGLAWRCQLAPLLGGSPRNAPKHVETCEMAANSATELLRESSNNFPFLQAND